MKKALKVGALTLTAALALSVTVAAQAPAASYTCAKKTTVTMLGTIKPEIQDQFLAAVADYNKSQSC